MNHNFAPGYTANVGNFVPDNLIADGYPIVTEAVTVLSGQNLVRGALVGKITASGKIVLSLSAAADGSQTPYGILSEDVDASSSDKASVIYIAGAFNKTKVTFGTGHTAASTLNALRDSNIYLRDVVA
jgi:hypothetical protein